MTRRHSVVSVLAAVLVGFSVWGVLIWRARTTTLTTAHLCGVIAQIIAASDASLGKPGAPGYVYYRDHPDELRAAHRANRVVLKRLPCQPPEGVTTP